MVTLPSRRPVASEEDPFVRSLVTTEGGHRFRIISAFGCVLRNSLTLMPGFNMQPIFTHSPSVVGQEPET